MRRGRIISELIDAQALEQLETLGGPELVREILQLYLDDTTTKIQALLAADAPARLEEVSRVAHSLKSSSANVGASKLRHLLARIEMVASGQADEPLAPLLQELQPAWTQTRALLVQELAQRP